MGGIEKELGPYLKIFVALFTSW